MHTGKHALDLEVFPYLSILTLSLIYRKRILTFWCQGYRGSEAHYTPTDKEILAAYKAVQNWSVLKHSFSWYLTSAGLDFQREGSLYTSCNWCYVEYVDHTDPIMSLHMKRQLCRHLGSDHKQARRQRFLEHCQRKRWPMLKRPHWIINYQKMRSVMPCSMKGPVIL